MNIQTDFQTYFTQTLLTDLKQQGYAKHLYFSTIKEKEGFSHQKIPQTHLKRYLLIEELQQMFQH